METFAILGMVALTASILAWPHVAGARLWRATITPLASIIGSGFLVLGPILTGAFGKWTVLAMAVLCLMAYAFGGVIRFNIISLDRKGHGALSGAVERVGAWLLAFAYVISVAYYLNLFGAFAVSLTGIDTTFAARCVTSFVFFVILTVGWTKGFSALEALEQVSVGVKLSIIAGLLLGLGWFFAQRATEGTLVFAPAAQTGWAAVTLLFGLVVTVQGFETSRYLEGTYDAVTRVRSMRLAQGVSTAIYMTYAALIALTFHQASIKTSETAIIDMMAVVAPVLPVLLVVAALSAQFSAAVADTSGSGGLIAELTRGKVSPQRGYAILVGLGLILTWTADVFAIIAFASKAFAGYYAAQCAVAVLLAHRDRAGAWRVAMFAAAAVLGIAVTVFGRAVA